MQVTSSNRPTRKQTGLNYTLYNKINPTNGIMNLHKDMATRITHDTEYITTEDNELKDGETSGEDNSG